MSLCLDSTLHHDILPLYRPETVHLVLTLANELKLYGERFAWFAGTKVNSVIYLHFCQLFIMLG